MRFKERYEFELEQNEIKKKKEDNYYRIQKVEVKQEEFLEWLKKEQPSFLDSTDLKECEDIEKIWYSSISTWNIQEVGGSNENNYQKKYQKQQI